VALRCDKTQTITQSSQFAWHETVLIKLEVEEKKEKNKKIHRTKNRIAISR